MVATNAAAINGAFSRGEVLGGQSANGSGSGISVAFDASKTWTGRSENITTDISIASNTTGISASSNNSTTGITAGSNSNTTGITASCSMTGDSVTRTKQFGVYYYIAF